MKDILPSSLRAAWRLAAVQLGLLLCPALQAAVTLTITPAAVSNTYNGLITLQVKGLTTGETVVVQKFLDLDGSGVIDASAWLVQQFQLTDGQPGMVIGGIVNSNVPGDTDTIAGQITAQLRFNNGDFRQTFGGKYLYKLSSPTGGFTPITNLFSVTSFPYAQKFTGNVVIEGTSTTVPNAIVVLETENGPAVGGVVANSSGGYTILAPPGDYVLAAFKSNYLFQNSKTLSALALGSGQTITTNLTVTSATASISGQVVDANNSSLGLPGILVSAQASSGLMAGGSTDTNGNFTLGVLSSTSQWGLKVDDTSLILHGYLGVQNRTDATAGQTGVSVAVPKATALFYGSVKDNLGNPLTGIDVYANDSNNNLYETDGYTDTNGNYFAAVLGGLGSNDPWYVSVNSDTGLANYLFSQPAFDQNGGLNISSGQAVQANFSALLATNYITGTVKDSNNNPLAGVGVGANATINFTAYSQYADTDANGNYSLNVANGEWSLSLNCSGGSDSLDNILGSGTYQCPNNENVTIDNDNGTTNFTVQLCSGITITTTSLPAGQVNVYYDQFIQASSCSSNFSWSLISGALPPGLNGNPSSGEIYGTPTNSGTFYFTVQVSDANGDSTNRSLSIYIAPSSSPLQITTSFLPDATNGVFYSQTLEASGGQTPYTWSIPGYSADPPPDLTLAPSGLLSGLPVTNGSFGFYVRVTDAASNVVDSPNPLMLDILSPPLQITNVSLPSGTVGAPYSAQLGAIGGQPPYNWGLAPASAGLPAGLTLDLAGLIYGTPTNSKVSEFRVQASDANGAVAYQVLSITINPATSLGSPRWVGNQFQMLLTGAANQNYTVLMSTNLASPNWISLFATNSATTNSFIVTDPSATNRQRFYRVEVGP